MCFIKIPKEIILQNTLDDKRVNIYSYLYIRKALDNLSGFSCNSMIEWCNYKSDARNGKINDKFKAMLQLFVQLGYIANTVDFKTEFSSNSFILVKLNQLIFNTKDNFSTLHLDEVNKIKEYKVTTAKTEKDNISFSKIILVLAYIRLYIIRRENKNRKNMPEFCYKTYQRIADDIGISKQSVGRAIKVLNELGIIYTEETPTYQDINNQWVGSVTLFVDKYRYHSTGLLDDTYDYMRELKWGKAYIINKKEWI